MVDSSAFRNSLDALTAALVLLLGLLLSLIGSGLLERLRGAAARQQEPGVEELLAGGAALAGTGLVAWWILSLACAAATVLLARKGHTRAAAATGKLLPAFMQRLVLGALSVQLLSGPAAYAAVTVEGPEWAPTQGESSSAPMIPGTEDPGLREADAALTGSSPSALATHAASGPLHDLPPRAGETSAPAMERAAVEAAPLSTFQPGWKPASPVIDPGMLAAPATRAPARAPGLQAGSVTVQAGDTLWDIAARYLGPGASDLDVALQWPRWYDANRALIGQNPDVLLPGQLLQPPSSAQE
jgi:hypothetical protein